MSELEQRLRATGKQYLTIADFIRAGLALSAGIENSSLYLRISRLTGKDAPESFGAMRVGGNIAFTLDSGIDYALHLERLWTKKEAA